MARERLEVKKDNVELFGYAMKSESESWLERLQTAKNLGKMNNMEGAFKLLAGCDSNTHSYKGLVNDSDRLVRKSALKSISKFSDKMHIKQTLKILKNAKNDQEQDIQKIAGHLHKELQQKRVKDFFSFIK